jgi:hypothetical protein
VRDEVGGERVQRQRYQRRTRTDQIPREREHHQPDEQRQQGDRQAGQHHQPAGVLAGLVQDLPAEVRLIAGEPRGYVQVRERQAGPDQELAQRRVLEVVLERVLIQLSHCGAHVDRFVGGRCLLRSGHDHAGRHLRQQCDHDEREQPAPVPAQGREHPTGRPLRGGLGGDIALEER